MVVEKPRGSNQSLKRKRKRRRKPRLTGLSKQRQTANARERVRMRSITAAMLQLRYHLPSSLAPKEKKLSKIQTLRFAIRYISDLWEVLQSADTDAEFHSVKEEHLVHPEGKQKGAPQRCAKFERQKTQATFLQKSMSHACAQNL